ncbi:MAG TPA: hypothetical protein VL094_07605 [Sphingomonadaceae bacterium]|nr:hypothetical protein [Sphingomonadaceae bacterium]
MKPLSALCAIALFALPAALSAESWEEVARLGGDIAVELDTQSVTKAQDGASEVLQATFRKDLPNAMMLTDVAVDCANEMAKIRSIRLMQEGKLASSSATPGAAFHTVNYGSSEAIYYKALCGRDILVPEGALLEEAPVQEAPAGDSAE